VTIRALVGNFASMTSLRLGLAGLTFALFWLLSHRLNTAQLGGFSLLMNAFFLVQTLPLLGMTMPLVRRIAAHPADTAVECSNSFFFALPVAATLGAGLALVGPWYVDEQLAVPFALLGLSLVPTAWTVVAECVLIGRERMQSIAYVNLLEAVGRLVGAWLAMQWHLGLTGVFCAFALMRFAAALAYLLNRNLPAPRWQLVRRATLQGYRRQVPTYLAIAVVAGLCTRLDIILVSKLLSLREAGIYAAAARLSDAALMVPTMAAVVIFPTQSRLFAADRAGFARVLDQAVRWCLIAGFAAALLVMAFSRVIIHWIYPANLASSAPILQLLILGTAVMVIDQLLSTTMLAAHAQRADLRSLTLGLVALATLLLILTHFFGLIGAACAPPLSIAIRVLYRLYWAQREFASQIVVVAGRVLLAAGAAVGILLLRVSSAVLVDVALAFSVYGIMLWMTRSVHTNDLLSLRHLIAQQRGSRA
jgi:O-antigen/teichoic acid export membrane protein